uniref:Uncharacterized protein n=1 Tax=Sinocyclocheilus anshuiensis TaxID=1608454 RepID=A0A671NNE5_9TELE
MPWMFLDWFVPVYLLVSVLVLAGFGACLYFLEPGLQDAHKWRNNGSQLGVQNPLGDLKLPVLKLIYYYQHN